MATTKRSKRGPTSLQFFAQLGWLDGRNLLDTIEPYRREVFTRALDTFDDNGQPRYSMVLAGRGKKNGKSLDLILAALFAFVIRRSVQGSDGIICASDEGQAADDLALAKKLVAVNFALAAEIEPMAKALRLRDGSATLKIISSNEDSAHGKTFNFLGIDEIHTARDWSMLEALAPDPTRADALTWITSYASLYHTPGAPLHDLMQIGKAGADKRLLFSWYSGDYCTDPAFAELPPLERANPSMASWPDGAGYLEQQRLRLPSGRFRRLHLNMPGSPEGAAFDQATILRAVVPGRRQLPYVPGRQYAAAVDMSGGSSDNAVLAIAHAEGNAAALDAVVKQNGSPPFDPRDAVRQFCAVLDAYKINRISGDAYGGLTFRLDFAAHGKTYDVVTTSASSAYESFEPALNAGEIELLDSPMLVEELIGLVWKGNKITHEHNSHDDHAAAAVLALNAVRAPAPMVITWDMVNAVMAAGKYDRHAGRRGY